MSESDEIMLWCWVLGDEHDRVFSVFIKRNALIYDLKTAIKGRTQSLKDIYPGSIVLYKLKISKKKLKGSTLTTVENWSRLRRPADTTITPSSSENSLNSPPPWLIDIHRELWGRRDLLAKIFRTATVNKDDFLKLQSLLDELNPERNSKEYVSKDVLATKAAFLSKKSTNLDPELVDGLVPRPGLVACQSPSSDVADEDRVVGDGDVVGDYDDAAVVIGNEHLPNKTTTIFPYTIQYVDLTVLQSKENLRVPRLMLFRNEWGTMIDIFNKREKGTEGSALFSGQPGIGKTCMLYSILVLCIILARPIVFQDMHGKVFIIGNTVRPLGTPGISSDANDILTLVDADNTVCQPHYYLLDRKQYRILLMSPPRKKDDRRWLKQIVGPNSMFIMKPWSRKELVVTSLFLESNDITLKRLQEASLICGNIPRKCFAAAVSPLALWAAKQMIKEAIKEIDDLSGAINKMRVGGETVIHRVFQIGPSSEHRLWIGCFVEPVSDWAFSEIMVALDARTKGRHC